jgi:hypothetical protein
LLTVNLGWSFWRRNILAILPRLALGPLSSNKFCVFFCISLNAISREPPFRIQPGRSPWRLNWTTTTFKDTTKAEIDKECIQYNTQSTLTITRSFILLPTSCRKRTCMSVAINTKKYKTVAMPRNCDELLKEMRAKEDFISAGE